MHARDLLHRVAELSAGVDRPVVLGVAGAPGVGKSYAAELLVRALEAVGLPSALVPMDGFHLSNTQLERLGRRDRKGAPDTFDVDGYVRLLAVLRSGHTGPVYVPELDRGLDEAVAAAGVVEPGTAVVVTEGNYLLHDALGWVQVADLLDLSVHLEAPAGVRRPRLVQRHVAGGRSRPAAESYVETVDEVNAALVDRGRGRADLVLDAARFAAELAAVVDPAGMPLRTDQA